MRLLFLSYTDAAIAMGILSTFVIPIIVSFLKRCAWPDEIKFLLSAFVSLGVAYVGLSLTNEYLEVSNVLFFASLLLNGATAVYQSIFKRYGWDKFLTKDYKAVTLPVPPPKDNNLT